MVQKGLIVLRAISSSSEGAMTLNIDSAEYAIDTLPNGLLTQSELNQVLELAPNALQGYVVWQEPVTEEPDDVE